MRFLNMLAVLAIAVGWGLEGRANAECARWLTENPPGISPINPQIANDFDPGIISFIRSLPIVELKAKPVHDRRHIDGVNFPITPDEISADYINFEGSVELGPKERASVQLQAKLPRNEVTGQFEPSFMSDATFATLEVHRSTSTDNGEAFPMIPLFYQGPLATNGVLYDRYHAYMKTRDGELLEVTAQIEFVILKNPRGGEIYERTSLAKIGVTLISK